MDNDRISFSVQVLTYIIVSTMVSAVNACTPQFRVYLAGPKPEWVHVNCHLPVEANANRPVSSWRYYVYPGGNCDECDCQWWLPCGNPPASYCPSYRFTSVGTYNVCVDVEEMDEMCNLLDEASDYKTVYAVSTSISVDNPVLNIGGQRIHATAHADTAGPTTNCRLRIGAGGSAPYVTGWSAETGGTCRFTGGYTSWEPPVPAGGGDVDFWVEGTGATNDCYLQVMYVDPYGGWHPGGCTPPRTSIIVAAPTNFRQTDVEDLGNGVLQFIYQWDSTSGNLADLYAYKIGERIDYPGSEDPWSWPLPPWRANAQNPTILEIGATGGVLYDSHDNGDPRRPYLASSFSSTQVYRYKTYNGYYTTMMGPHSITRSVWSGDPYWGYSLEKTGSTAMWYPLP